MNKISLKDDSSKDHLISQFLKDPLYKVDKDGRVYSKLTLNGQGVTDKWRELGYKKSDGYVRCRYKDDFLFIHRIVFWKFNGPIKPGFTIDHDDKNNSNNHPKNLIQKTQGDNNKNKSKKYNKSKKSFSKRREILAKVKQKLSENNISSLVDTIYELIEDKRDIKENFLYPDDVDSLAISKEISKLNDLNDIVQFKSKRRLKKWDMEESGWHGTPDWDLSEINSDQEEENIKKSLKDKLDRILNG
ncbi:HNH endonuclease [bacterium]|nr:HNH endonuclease [bacterium]